MYVAMYMCVSVCMYVCVMNGYICVWDDVVVCMCLGMLSMCLAHVYNVVPVTLQKADRAALEGKASREWVDSTFERLDREIREAKSKMVGQEEAFKTAMSQINEDVDGKLDRNELEPLKEYFGMPPLRTYRR